MADSATPPISTTVNDRILVRGYDLTDELIGRLTFTEMFLLDLHGAMPSPAHVRMMDAVLVATMEHGITPSSLVSRLTMDAAPESIQGAIAAGLLANGSRYLGVIEEVAALLQRVVSDAQENDEGVDAAAQRAVSQADTRNQVIPGFGHNLHRQTDPRVQCLLDMAESEGVLGQHHEALRAVQRALPQRSGRPLIMNAAGATGAILSDLGYLPGHVRGFASVARCAGLLAHIVDEAARPIARNVWQESHQGFGAK